MVFLQILFLNNYCFYFQNIWIKCWFDGLCLLWNRSLPWSLDHRKSMLKWKKNIKYLQVLFVPFLQYLIIFQSRECQMCSTKWGPRFVWPYSQSVTFDIVSTGTEEWLFLGETHCFFTFEYATLLKKLWSQPLKLCEAHASDSVLHWFRGPCVSRCFEKNNKCY